MISNQVAKSVHNMRNRNFIDAAVKDTQSWIESSCMRNDPSEKIKNGWNVTKEDLKSGGKECPQYEKHEFHQVAKSANNKQIMNTECQWYMDMKKNVAERPLIFWQGPLVWWGDKTEKQRYWLHYVEMIRKYSHHTKWGGVSLSVEEYPGRQRSCLL